MDGPLDFPVREPGVGDGDSRQSLTGKLVEQQTEFGKRLYTGCEIHEAESIKIRHKIPDVPRIA